VPIEGPLRELGIHDVFQLLDLSRKTGVLMVTSTLRRNEGSVSFDQGAIVAAEIKTNPHQLGAMLVNSGKITPEDLKRALDQQAKGDGARLGEILVEMALVSQRELEEHVRFQIEEVVFEVMNWREGYFSFNEGPVAPRPDGTAVRIPTGSLLMEGARRIDEWSRMERGIPHLGMVPALAPVAPSLDGELALQPAEWEVLAAVDGERDVRGLAQVLGRSEFELAKTVFGMVSAGLILLLDPAKRPVRGTPEPQGAHERAVAALAMGDIEGARAAAEAGAALHPREPRAQWVLGRVALQSGRAAEGEEYQRRALRLDPLFPPAHRTLGDALALQGRYAEAVDWWRRWLALDDPGRAPEAAEQVEDTIRAAETLDSLLRMPHG
jgi:tetratricopeptide (TPR) repeat protein